MDAYDLFRGALDWLGSAMLAAILIAAACFFILCAGFLLAILLGFLAKAVVEGDLLPILGTITLVGLFGYVTYRIHSDFW